MYSDYRSPTDHLPDPERQAAFYEGVTIKRGIAWVFDTVIILILAVLVSVFTVVGLFFFPLFYIGVGFLYRTFTIAGGSATWGMRLMAIELRDAHGRRLDLMQAFLHTLGYSLTISTLVLQMVSVGFMAASPRGQGLTDMLLGTVMLNRRA